MPELMRADALPADPIDPAAMGETDPYAAMDGAAGLTEAPARLGQTTNPLIRALDLVATRDPKTMDRAAEALQAAQAHAQGLAFGHQARAKGREAIATVYTDEDMKRSSEALEAASGDLLQILGEGVEKLRGQPGVEAKLVDEAQASLSRLGRIMQPGKKDGAQESTEAANGVAPDDSARVLAALRDVRGCHANLGEGAIDRRAATIHRRQLEALEAFAMEPADGNGEGWKKSVAQWYSSQKAAAMRLRDADVNSTARNGGLTMLENASELARVIAQDPSARQALGGNEQPPSELWRQIETDAKTDPAKNATKSDRELFQVAAQGAGAAAFNLMTRPGRGDELGGRIMDVARGSVAWAPTLRDHMTNDGADYLRHVPLAEWRGLNEKVAAATEAGVEPEGVADLRERSDTLVKSMMRNAKMLNWALKDEPREVKRALAHQIQEVVRGAEPESPVAQDAQSQQGELEKLKADAEKEEKKPSLGAQLDEAVVGIAKWSNATWRGFVSNMIDLHSVSAKG